MAEAIRLGSVILCGLMFVLATLPQLHHQHPSGCIQLQMEDPPGAISSLDTKNWEFKVFSTKRNMQTSCKKITCLSLWDWQQLSTTHLQY